MNEQTHYINHPTEVFDDCIRIPPQVLAMVMQVEGNTPAAILVARAFVHYLMYYNKN